PDALASALSTQLLPEHVAAALQETLPVAAARTPQQWQEWAKSRAALLRDRLEGTAPRTRDAMRKVRQASALQQSLQRIATLPTHLLVVTDDPSGGVTCDVLWAASLAESYLWRHTPRI